MSAWKSRPESLETGPTPKRLAFFDRYLTVWVFACMVVGVALGRLAPGLATSLNKLEFGEGLQVNAAMAVLLWLMICR